MDLERRQGDRAHLDKTFRAAHTIKGAAAMVGLEPSPGSRTASRRFWRRSGLVRWQLIPTSSRRFLSHATIWPPWWRDMGPVRRFPARGTSARDLVTCSATPPGPAPAPSRPAPGAGGPSRPEPGLVTGRPLPAIPAQTELPLGPPQPAAPATTPNEATAARETSPGHRHRHRRRQRRSRELRVPGRSNRGRVLPEPRRRREESPRPGRVKANREPWTRPT